MRIIIPLLLMLSIISLVVSTAVSSDTEVVIIVKSDNITAYLIGEPDIDQVVINGHDLDSLLNKYNENLVWTRRLLRRVHYDQQKILKLISKILEELKDVKIIINKTVIRINNNTLLILRNREDLLTLTLILNRTICRIEEVNSTLNNRLSSIEDENTYLWKSISSLRAEQYSDKKRLLEEINSLRRELQNVKMTYERRLALQELNFKRSFLIYTFALLLGILLVAVIVLKIH